MARLNREELIAAAKKTLSAVDDPSGEADLVFDKGQILVASESTEMKKAFKTAKKIATYKWVLINAQDLLAANMLSIGSKAGIITPEGKVLKAPDIPRRKV